MTKAKTPRETHDGLLMEAAKRLRTACELSGESFASVALAVGRDNAIVKDWAKNWELEEGGFDARLCKPVPIALIANPRVPRAVRVALLAWLTTTLDQDAAHVAVETATTCLLKRAGELLSTVAPMLSDGHIDPGERAELLPHIVKIHQLTGQWIAQHGADDSSTRTRN